MSLENKKMKNMMIGVIIILSIVASAIVFIPGTTGNFTYGIYNFSSYSELESYLEKAINQGNQYYFELDSTSAPRNNVGAEKGSSSNDVSQGIDYSETNIQVAGVDEPDIVKTDGSYIYTISGSSVHIIQAYPIAKIHLLGYSPFKTL